MGGIGLALLISFLITGSVAIWGETSKSDLRKELSESTKSVQQLKGELKEASSQVTELSEELESLKADLDRVSAEKKRLETALETEELRKANLKEEWKRTELGKEKAEVRAQLEASYASKIADLEEKLAESKALKEKLEKEFVQKFEEARKEKELASAILSKQGGNKAEKDEEARKASEESLKNYKVALGKIDARLKADEAALDIDALSSKLKDARLRLNEAASSTPMDREVKKKIEADLDDAEKMLRDVHRKRSGAEELLTKELEKLSEDADITGMILKRRFEETSLSLENLQKNLMDQNREAFQHRVASLEGRLVVLEDEKKAIDTKWSETMTAVVSLDEIAKRIERGLKTDSEKAGTLDVNSPDAAAFKNDLEALRQAKENVRSAILNVKSTIEKTLDSESKRMSEETTQVSSELSKLLSAVEPGVEAKALSAPRQTVMLNTRLEDLKELINKVFENEKITGTQTGLAASLIGNCEKQIRELMAGGDSQFNVYVVKTGDSLWNIAAKKEVYGNSQMWPLLYRNNVFITDPDRIAPNTKLFIKRSLTEGEINAAINEVRGLRLKR